MRLYTVETMRQRHITTVSANSREEATRKAWRKIATKRPDIVPYLRQQGLLVMLQNTGGSWGAANFNGERG
jgi:hypothetical protein